MPSWHLPDSGSGSVQKLDVQTVPSAQNTDDNGSQKPKAEPNVNLYRTLSLAASASTVCAISFLCQICETAGFTDQIGPIGSRGLEVYFCF